jgi:hypothetical protein
MARIMIRISDRVLKVVGLLIASSRNDVEVRGRIALDPAPAEFYKNLAKGAAKIKVDPSFAADSRPNWLAEKRTEGKRLA